MAGKKQSSKHPYIKALKEQADISLRGRKVSVPYFRDYAIYGKYIPRMPGLTLDRILFICFKVIAEGIIDGRLVRLPYHLGELEVALVKRIRNPQIDWDQSQRLWKEIGMEGTVAERKPVIRFLNEELDGYIHRIVWHPEEDPRLADQMGDIYKYKAAKWTARRSLIAGRKGKGYPYKKVKMI